MLIVLWWQAFSPCCPKLFSASCTIFRAKLELSQADSQSSPRYSLQQQEAPDGVVILMRTARVFIFCTNTWDMLKHETREWVVLRYASWNVIHIWVWQILIFLCHIVAAEAVIPTVKWCHGFQSTFLFQTACEFLKLLLSGVVQVLSLLYSNQNREIFFHLSLKNCWKGEK